MSNFNLNMTVIGNVGKAEMKYFDSGTAVLNFSVAANLYRGKDNDKETVWVQCSLFGERAEKLANYINVGSFVVVNGEPSVRAYVNKAGEAAASLNLRVNEIVFGGKKSHEGDEEPNGNGYAGEYKQQAEDVPF